MRRDRELEGQQKGTSIFYLNNSLCQYTATGPNMIELRFVVLNGFLSFSLLVKSIIKKPLELTRTRNVKTSGLTHNYVNNYE